MVDTLMVAVLLPHRVENMHGAELQQWAMKTIRALGAHTMLSNMLDPLIKTTGHAEEVLSSLTKWAHTTIKSVTTAVPNLLAVVLRSLSAGSNEEAAVGVLILSYLVVLGGSVMQAALRTIYTAWSSDEQAATSLLELLTGKLVDVPGHVLEAAMALGQGVVSTLAAMFGTIKMPQPHGK